MQAMSSSLQTVILQQKPVKLLLGVLVISAAIFVATTATDPNSSCNRTCGSLEIPYPFGTSEGCYLDSSFLITCNSSSNSWMSNSTPYLRVSNIKVLNISLDGELRVSTSVARDCPQESDYSYNRLTLREFPISYSKNVLTTIGCDTRGFITSLFSNKNYTTGYVLVCDSIDGMVNGSCSGLGCCQTPIPDGLKDFTVWASSPENHTKVNKFNPCSFAFVVEEKAYKFSTLDLQNMQNKDNFPLVLDWAIGNDTCENPKKNTTGSYACKVANSNCYNSKNGSGYLCNCSSGYQGNPYLFDGCQDIDECNTPNHGCAVNAICVNHMGSYSCSCPIGYQGDGWRNGSSCTPVIPKPCNSKNIIIALCISISLLVLLLGGSSVLLGLKRRKLIKLQEKYFQQNGGLMLREHILNHGRSMETTKIFSNDELKKATNNYDESRVHGKGGYGTVYKGVLPDNKEVAIKK